MVEWRPIETAPRDGSVIEVMHEDSGCFAMRWNASGWNDMVSIEPGIWEDPQDRFTWCEARGFGPSHWRPLTADATETRQ